MAETKVDLSDYIPVAERIATFAERYPEGCLSRLDPQGQLVPLQFVSYAGADWVILTAFAYRDAEDRMPGVGTAWERIPGVTPYTRGSEVQNAETSAWGRAIVAVLAADTSRGIASADEVRQAVDRQQPLPPRDFLAEAKAKATAQDVRLVWREAKAKGAPESLLERIAKVGADLSAAEDGTPAEPRTVQRKQPEEAS